MFRVIQETPRYLFLEIQIATTRGPVHRARHPGAEIFWKTHNLALLKTVGKLPIWENC